MFVTIYFAIVAGLLYLGYVLSLYSSVAYVEPERIEHLIEKLSGFRRKYLNEILEYPRISLQLAIVFKSLLLILISLMIILACNHLGARYNVPLNFTYLIGLVLVWILYLIFIEILPRRRVLRLEDKEILKYLPFYASVYVIFKPIVTFYGGVFVGENSRIVPEDQKEDIVERAIETLADQAGISEPIVEEDEKEMIGQIFQLDVTEVREVMVPRINIKGFDKNATLEDIKYLTKEVGHSRYPVYDENPDKIIGILYVKDLFTGIIHEGDKVDITNFVQKPFFVHEKKIISDLLADFKTNKVHIAIVIDEYGGTSGLVTLEDILEEIVGEIQDEHDYEKEPIVRLSDNSYRVDAALPVEELLEELHLDYENGEFETVGGLIYDLIGSVPAIDTTIKWKDIFFEVEKVEGQRIISVKVWVKKGTEI